MKRYGGVTRKKADGATFTPPALAGFVARQVCQFVQPPAAGTLRICDPAVGEGALLFSLLAELTRRRLDGSMEVYGFDKNPASLAAARTLLERHYPRLRLYLRLG
ncbi:MAG TPA: N-6 DNA methylase [Bryobacteraceae bacterium]|nr:N-6 DNA methylase [Bryobacteraceae bacterium]